MSLDRRCWTLLLALAPLAAAQQTLVYPCDATSVGVTPRLTAVGTLEAGSLRALCLREARPVALATLIVGLAQIDAPFEGGVLVPSPTILLPLGTGPSGALDVSASWPAGLPSLLTTYYQYWIADPEGPKGFTASNAVAGTTP